MNKSKRSILTTMCVLLVFFSSVRAFGQAALGVKGGVPIRENFLVESSPDPLHFPQYATDTKRYTVGPTFELRLTHGFALEVDALYRRLDYESRTVVPGLNSLDATTGNSWEFPLLVKYRIGSGAVIPFVDAGGSLRHVEAVTQSCLVAPPAGFGACGDPFEARELVNRFSGGFVFGAGLRFHTSFFSISPEIRYTRWASDAFRNQIGDVTLIRSNPNQLDFLIGFTLPR